jgi:nitrous oxide reductase accessory protein NosL
MKKTLLGTAILLALLTGCSEEEKAPEQTQAVSEDVKKDDAMPVMVMPSNEEIEKEDAMPVLLNPSDEELEKDELAPKEGEEELPVQDEEPVEQGK